MAKTTKRAPASIHAKCAAWRATPDGRTDICGKSRGHTDSALPGLREHSDPDSGARWTD